MVRHPNIADVPVNAQTFEHALDILHQWAADTNGRRYVSTCTVYTMMRALEDERILAALRGADMVTADGLPLVWLQKFRGKKPAERVYGPDVTLELCQRTANDPAITHYFFGGLPGVPERLVGELQQRFPGIQIAGAYSPPVEDVGSAPNPAMVELLNTARPSIIWVGLGSPKQDLWMHLYRPALDAPLLIAVGAAFDFIGGTKQQAPVWMRRRGLEWLFRLLQEPRRLWQRYLVYNTRFVWQVISLYLQRAL
jgi:N-acetylglucosaminyldiphosphoundecaprenol N-acetyl-beta-D-mannosaminyltransferase